MWQHLVKQKRVRKKLAKMEIVETISEKPKPHFDFKFSRKPSRLVFEAKDLVIGYNEPLSSEINLKVESGQKNCLYWFQRDWEIDFAQEFNGLDSES